MAVTPYQGHAEWSASKIAATNPDDVAPADEPGYDPSEFSDQPGVTALTDAGYPRLGGEVWTGGGTGQRSGF